MDTQEKNNLIKDLMTIEDITDIGSLGYINFTEEEEEILNDILEQARMGNSRYKADLKYIFGNIESDEMTSNIGDLKNKLLIINSDIEISVSDGIIAFEW